MSLILRKQAISWGLNVYFTGKPCHKGHVASRYVKTHCCILCWADVNAASYAKNVEARRIKDRQRRSKDAAKLRNSDKKFQAEVAKLRRAKGRKWRKANPEASSLCNARRRTRALNAGLLPSVNELKSMLDKQFGLCANPHCLVSLSKVKKHLDHRNPISRGGLNNFENLQWLCAPCNVRKGARTHEEWMMTFEMERAA